MQTQERERDASVYRWVVRSFLSLFCQCIFWFSSTADDDEPNSKKKRKKSLVCMCYSVSPFLVKNVSWPPLTLISTPNAPVSYISENISFICMHHREGVWPSTLITYSGTLWEVKWCVLDENGQISQVKGLNYSMWEVLNFGGVS